MNNLFLRSMIPIWVSRPKSDGTISSWSISGWVFVLIGATATINLAVWPLIGLVFAAKIVIGLF